MKYDRSICRLHIMEMKKVYVNKDKLRADSRYKLIVFVDVHIVLSNIPPKLSLLLLVVIDEKLVSCSFVRDSSLVIKNKKENHIGVNESELLPFL